MTTTATAATDHNPQAGAGRPLPKKEADLFRSVVKHYEMKQYKKAVKQADTILKKFPNHGETLAMKGLTLNYMSKRDEAHELVKEGLKNDMRSHVCWHVYGLLHRSDRKYNEAIKAYKQALRIDPGNLQILRDLSMLQIQMRDLKGFAVTRNTLLTLKANAKINWMAFALARHLTGDLRGAVKVIDIYLGTLTEESEELGRCFESSELALYRNRILAEIPNNYKEALDHLQACESIVVDRSAWLMRRAEYQFKLQDFVGAEQSVMAMFHHGMTEDHKAHSLYMCVLLKLNDETIAEECMKLVGTQTLATMIPLSKEQKELINKAYTTELAALFPNSIAIQRIPLTLLEGEELKKALDQICQRQLTRGVPSLCSELYSFMWLERNGKLVRPTDPVEIKAHPIYSMITELADGYIANLLSNQKLTAEDEKVDDDQTTLLWARFLRAGLHELVADYAEGIAELDRCIEQTPTEVDVYEMKARMLKATGDLKGAVECVDKGRELDRQDRYINNLTTKYMLQAGMEEDALKTIALFTKHEGNPEQNLYDMQCSWYELEVADSYFRKEDWGRALKRYSAIATHFNDINEDQFDFHGYCLRKVTLRAYVDVLRFEDELYGQKYFCQAAAGLIRTYLHLIDNPIKDQSDEPDYSQMSAAERKKAKAIARKKKKATEKKEEKAEENGGAKKSAAAKGGKNSFVDEDPLGEEYLKKDPIEEAKKYSSMLVQYAPKNIETWILQYDVAVRRKKALMALQALHKARAIEPMNSELFTRIVEFAGMVDTFKDFPDAVRIVLVDETPPLLNGKSVSAFLQDSLTGALADTTCPLPYRTAVAKSLVDKKIASVADAAKLITKTDLRACRGVSADSCRNALTALKSFGNEAEGSTREWIASVKDRFPLLPSFL